MDRFSAVLSGALDAHGVDVNVVAMAQQPPLPGDQTSESAPSPSEAASLLNQSDVAIVQHEFDGQDDLLGRQLIDIIARLVIPSIVIAHAVPKSPTSHQRWALEALAAAADHVVVMSEVAKSQLELTYSVDRGKVSTIPHGATVPSAFRMKRPSRPTILTWGWLGPGSGVERVIGAMASLGDVPGRPRYVIAGPTHPKVLAADGEAYRLARAEQVRCAGAAHSVSLDPGHYDGAMLTTLILQSSVVVLPYDSSELVSSRVLVESVAHGRPVVATAFPHAIELLGSGAGIVVDHDDPVALASALRQVITRPRMAGSMAAEARRLAPQMSWPVVADGYAGLARRLLAHPRVRG